MKESNWFSKRGLVLNVCFENIWLKRAEENQAVRKRIAEELIILYYTEKKIKKLVDRKWKVRTLRRQGERMNASRVALQLRIKSSIYRS